MEGQMEEVLLGAALIAASVVVQAAAQAALMAWLRRRQLQLRRGDFGPLAAVWLVVVSVLALFTGHLLQVGLWAHLYVRIGALGSLADGFYFSMTSFTTVGYGDLVLAPQTRLLGAIEAANGMLMFGWSTALLFAIISAVYRDLLPGGLGPRAR